MASGCDDCVPSRLSELDFDTQVENGKDCPCTVKCAEGGGKTSIGCVVRPCSRRWRQGGPAASLHCTALRGC